jgi:hypothetical protein
VPFGALGSVRRTGAPAKARLHANIPSVATPNHARRLADKLFVAFIVPLPPHPETNHLIRNHHETRWDGRSALRFLTASSEIHPQRQNTKNQPRDA